MAFKYLVIGWITSFIVILTIATAIGMIRPLAGVEADPDENIIDLLGMLGWIVVVFFIIPAIIGWVVVSYGLQ